MLLCSHVWSAESQESFPAQFCATVKLIALKSCSYKTSAYLGASLSSVWRSGLWRAAQDNKKVLQHLHDLTPPCQRGSAVLRCSSCSIPVPLRVEPGGSLLVANPISQSGAGRQGRVNKANPLTPDILASLVSLSQNLIM